MELVGAAVAAASAPLQQRQLASLIQVRPPGTCRRLGRIRWRWRLRAPGLWVSSCVRRLLWGVHLSLIRRLMCCQGSILIPPSPPTLSVSVRSPVRRALVLTSPPSDSPGAQEAGGHLQGASPAPARWLLEAAALAAAPQPSRSAASSDGPPPPHQLQARAAADLAAERLQGALRAAAAGGGGGGAVPPAMRAARHLAAALDAAVALEGPGGAAAAERLRCVTWALRLLPAPTGGGAQAQVPRTSSES